MHSPHRARDSVAGIIIVIISQMKKAKLELCPSPSGWLTVTNASLIHPTHQLYTGQRSPERQEAAEAPLHVQYEDTPQHSVLIVSVFPLTLWEQEAACHYAFSHCCYVWLSCILFCGNGQIMWSTMKQWWENADMRTNCFPLHVCCIHLKSRNDVNIYITDCDQINVFPSDQANLTDCQR